MGRWMLVNLSGFFTGGFPKPFSRFWCLRWLLEQMFMGSYYVLDTAVGRLSGAAAYFQDKGWIQYWEGLVVAEPVSFAFPPRASQICLSLLALCLPFPSSKGLWFCDAYLWHILFPLSRTHFGSVLTSAPSSRLSSGIFSGNLLSAF